ncbi:MAG: GNAT family N-acetyltransferase [Microscillaceae bacterium]|jgi:ribosomal protein S18 acetylase RimI-like enzyme|nr:GNAT family N-acetyltransferase [Microscillaceae bacterium]
MYLTYYLATSEQLPLILDLLKQASIWLQSQELKQWAFWQNPPADKIAWLQQGLDAQEFYLVKAENDIAGMYRLMTEDELYWGKQTQAAAYVHSLVVKKEFAGQKLGAKILQAIENQLIKRSIPRLRLDCVAENLALCAYYEKQGFVKVGQKQMPHSLNNLYEKTLF